MLHVPPIPSPSLMSCIQRKWNGWKTEYVKKQLYCTRTKISIITWEGFRKILTIFPWIFVERMRHAWCYIAKSLGMTAIEIVCTAQNTAIVIIQILFSLFLAKYINQWHVVLYNSNIEMALLLVFIYFFIYLLLSWIFNGSISTEII
jgi:hypothetical protein